MYPQNLTESERINDELVILRQVIMRVDPMVIHDGRFEKMIISPWSTLAIAREMLEQIPHLRQ